MFRPTALAAAVLLASPVSGQLSISYSNSEAMEGSFSVDKDRARFELGFPAYGNPPLVIEAPLSGVVEVEGGWRATGDLSLPTPLGPLPLLEADLFFERTSSGSIRRMRGRCAVPPPFVSDRVRVASPAMAEIGCDLGSKIHLGVPLARSRTYLFFRFEAGFSVEFATSDDADATAPISVGIPAGIDGTLILDPGDPFYFLGGAFLGGKDKDKDDQDSDSDNSDSDKDTHRDSDSSDRDDSNDDSKDDSNNDKSEDSDNEEEDESNTTGEGRSENGHIPFAPLNVQGIEQQVQGFWGHQVKTGSVPIGQLPLMVEGYMVTRFDSNADDGFDPLGVGIAPAYRAGANGDILVTFPLAKIAGVGALAEFGFGLGTATAGVEVIGDRQIAYFSGVIDPDLSWLPNATPFRPDGEARVVGFLSSDLPESYLDLWGRVGVDVSHFARLAGLDLGEMLWVESTMRADKTGLAVSGRTGAAIGPFVPSGEVELSARIGWPEDTELRLAGAFELARGQFDGEVVFTPGGARIAGATRGAVELELSGKIQSQGGGLLLAADIVPSSEFQAELANHATAAAKNQRTQVDSALAELQAANKNYEVELSLRGIRKVIPTLTSRAIKQIEGIPSIIKKRWPKKFGRELPGRKTATKKAQKDSKPTIARLKRLNAAAKGGSDARFRSEIKSAIESLIKYRRLKIKVKLVGTVYNKDVISSGQVSQLRQAIAAVDALPAASNRKISAQQIYESVPVSSVLDEVQAGIDQGLTENLPVVESISAIIPLPANGEAFEATARIRAGGDQRDIAVKFHPDYSPSFPIAVAKAWLRSVVPGN